MTKNTIEVYHGSAKRFMSFLENKGVDIRQTTKGDVTDFINSEGEVSPSTWNNKLAYLKQYFKWLQSSRITFDITGSVRRKKVKRGFAKKSIPASVVKEMHEYFKNRIDVCKRSSDKRLSLATAYRDYAFFCVICSLGSRAGLSTKIKVGDIGSEFNSSGGKVAVIRIKDKARETMTARPIPPYVFDSIEEYITHTGNTNPDNYLFQAHNVTADNKKPISYMGVRNRIDAVFIKLGIKAKTTDKNRVTPHSLRHSLAELLYELYGAEYVQHFYGHASIDTTQQYAGRNKDRKLLDNRPDIEGVYGMR